MSHQKQSIPKLFREIIRHDRLKPKVVQGIVDLQTYKNWSQRHHDLQRAARRYFRPAGTAANA